MIHCKELNQDFESKRSMFDYLKSNKDVLIAEKKSRIYKSHEKENSVSIKSINSLKSIGTEKEISIDEDYYYIAVNTTKILDSHNDLHADGIWNKTAKDKTFKNYLTLDHEVKTDKIAAYRKDVEIFVAEIPFTAIGKSYSGTTEALIYKVRKDKIINDTARKLLEDKDSEIEASVRMRYIDLELALNSDDDNDISEKKVYDDYINIIANKEDFQEGIEYFWLVKQASNEIESSLVPLGSNSATGKITDNKNQPSNDTEEKTEPSNDTQIIETIKNYTSKI